jgi:diaminopimelate decarboxylase
MQNFLRYKNNQLYLEDKLIQDIVTHYGTPCYAYSLSAIENNWQAFQDAFEQAALKMPYHICYAVKANSNIGLLKLFAKKNAGFDIVSQGELERVLAAGGDPQKIIFSGVGKTHQEIIRALEVGIFCFNVESEAELERIQQIAHQRNQQAAITLRINPNIDAKTHPYIATGLHENKFGIDINQVSALCKKLQNMPYIKIIGIGAHIGSQLTEIDPFLASIDCLLTLADTLTKERLELKTINLGGGLGIRYKNEFPPTINEYVAAICHKLTECPYEIIIEPGRALIANTGVLLTKVEYLKRTAHKLFAIMDAGMNDLVRPALYQAWHDILPATLHTTQPLERYDIVGPVCESGDFLGFDRELALQPEDILAITDVGAYGACMSSNYNSRLRAAEVLIDRDSCYLLRERDSFADLIRLEKMI